MTNTLDKIKPGQTVRVTKLGGEGAVRRRIMDMGLTKGTKVDTYQVITAKVQDMYPSDHYPIVADIHI